MKFQTKALLKDLTIRTQKNLTTAQTWLELPLKQLQYKPNANSWSILECIEHLNLYSDFYVPEIKTQMDNSKHQGFAPVFKSSWLGNYFAQAMLPKEKLNKMKTFADKDTNGSTLTKSVLEKFIQHQKKTLLLLEQAEQVNLTKTTTGITLTQWIKLRLGDTFRVIIYHNDRHIIQAKNVLAQLPTTLENSTQS